MVKITIKGYTETAAMLERVKSMITSGEISEAIRENAVQLVKKNFDRLGTIPNKLGGASTGYWKQASDKTTSTVQGGSVIITISHTGIRMHLTGQPVIKPKGTSEITGKPIKFLTIPKVAAAHGKTVATLRSLGVELYPGRGGLLRQSGPTRNPDTDEMWFVLAKSAKIKANPQVLPSEAALAATAGDAVRNILAVFQTSHP